MHFVYVDITVCVCVCVCVCVLSFELLNQASDLFETLYECRVILGLLNFVREYLVVINNELRHAVAQLVEALRYDPEGRGFDSRWCNWNF